jgi:DNA topoisomerase-1
MSDAKLERTNVKIEANNEIFTASGEVFFEGFLKVYLEVMMTMKKSRECYRR